MNRSFFPQSLCAITFDRIAPPLGGCLTLPYFFQRESEAKCGVMERVDA